MRLADTVPAPTTVLLNIAFQRDLSLSHANVGRILLKQEQVDAALDAFRASLAIADQLAAADSRNALFQRDLSAALNRVGDALAAQGQLPEALEQYRRSLAIREQLAATDPSSAALQRDVSLAHDRIANILAKQGRVQEAISEFQVSLGIAARLSASDPGNAAWRRDLYASYRNLGLTQERGGQSKEARETYCRAKKFILAEPELEPELEPEWQQRLSWLEQRLIYKQSNLPGGAFYIEQSMQSSRESKEEEKLKSFDADQPGCAGVDWD